MLSRREKGRNGGSLKRTGFLRWASCTQSCAEVAWVLLGEAPSLSIRRGRMATWQRRCKSNSELLGSGGREGGCDHIPTPDNLGF